jgi:5'-3' exonuclease
MGIPYYVASLLRKHKHIQKPAPVTTQVLAIDFNCFIHRYLDPANPVGSLVTALKTLLTTTAIAGRVFVAFDGLVPYAKMVQQRYRRFRIPDATGDAPTFDKHQISPGTPFMRELATAIRTNFPEVEVSDTEQPGEGEHKMFRWFRTLPVGQTICIYGLDADLVLISIAQSHLGTLCILREQEETGFSVLSVDALKAALPMDPHEYVKMSIFAFGNDFMPPIAMYSLREDGYSRALHSADDLLSDTKELSTLIQHAKETDRRIVAPDGHALESRFSAHLMDGVLNWEPVVYAFWKTYYWTLHYFTTSEVLDWMWVYPYPEAPLLSTLNAYDIPRISVWEHPTPPFTIRDQLRLILPDTSLATTGIPPIFPNEMYNEAVDVRHPWMRRFQWECDPYISLPWGRLTAVSEYPLA